MDLETLKPVLERLLHDLRETAFRLWGHPIDPGWDHEDLVQEGFIAIWKAAQKPGAFDKARPRTIAYRGMVDFLRKASGRTHRRPRHVPYNPCKDLRKQIPPEPFELPVWLTPRQRVLCQALAEGRPKCSAARELGIDPAHMTHALKQLRHLPGGSERLAVALGVAG